MKKIVKNMITAMLMLLCIVVCAAPVQTKAAGKITLNYKSATMQAGSRIDLNVADGSEVKISQKVTWKSSNKKIATVNKNGIVKAKKNGTVTITAAAGKNRQASCKIKVQKKISSDTNILVAYFSCTNTTKGIAKKIAKASGGELYRVTPAKAYTSADLNYSNDYSRATREQNNKKQRPQMKGKTVDMDNYDVVFIGYPIWWGDAPRIVSTFVESCNLKGKTVIPFCTSGSSGISSSVKTLKSQAGGTWLSGKRFGGNESQNAVAEWVDGLDIGIQTDGQNNTGSPDQSESKPSIGEETPAEPSVPADEGTPTESSGNNKILVAYFSCTNTTKGIAENIAQASGGDLYQIVPEVPYTSEDLNYGSQNSRTSMEQNNPSSRPAISIV